MASARTESTSYSPEQRRVLMTVLVPAFMSLLSVSIINVTLPAIDVALDAGTSGLQWVVSGYALVFGVLLVPAGRAGDLWGRARLFAAGLALFGLGALLSGFATSILMLNLARLVMGIGSGLLNPQVTGMIQTFFQGPLRGRAFGAFGGVVGVSVAVGPLLGGALIGLLGAEQGWRWAFFINVPIALLGIVAARRLLPAAAWSPNQAEGATAASGRAGRAGANAPGHTATELRGHRARVDFDPIGMALLALATVLVMVPFMELRVVGWAWAAAIFGLGVLLVAAWLAWERRYARRGGSPMVDLGLFTTRSFASGSLLIGLFFLGYTSVWLVLAQYLQAGLGHTALESGLVGLPAALAGAVAAPIAGRHVHRVGRRLVVWGLAIVLLGLVLSILVVLGHERGVSEWWLLAALGIAGLGQGLVVSPNQTLSLAEVPLRYAGSAGGVIQTGQRIGTSIGIAVFTSVAFGGAAAQGWDAGFAFGIAAVAAVIALALGVGLVDLRLDAVARRGESPAR